MAKMGNTLIALCSAAIGVVYTAGYVVTNPSNTQAAQTVSAIAASSDRQAAGSQASQQNNQQSTSQDQGSSQLQASNQTQVSNQTKYKDGTFTGSGTNRFGTVEVAITIKKGEITDCKITNCSTHYPQDYIDPELPNEVVQRQGEQVDVVSGATRSTEDFEMAVDQALQQAQTHA